jgi:penicillin-insensitive murein endopeptidase
MTILRKVYARLSNPLRLFRVSRNVKGQVRLTYSSKSSQGGAAATFLRRGALIFAVILAGAANAQEKGSLTPKPLPPLANPSSPTTPAKELFGRAAGAAPLTPDPIGFYSKGCLAGARQLPQTGPNWQVMRLSRNRNWGHPSLIDFLERFAPAAARASGWPGILVGDMSQPRGGPMLTGHASHQIGLDADVWLTPMPPRLLTAAEREDMSAVDMVRQDQLDIDPRVWTDGQLAVVRTAALDPTVQRIFVNAAIKRAICRTSAGEGWMGKVRPMFGHNYHFHIRLFCPRGAENCRDQDPTPPGDGCDRSLAWWFTDEALHPKRSTKTWPPMTMTALPAECREVLNAQ